MVLLHQSEICPENFRLLYPIDKMSADCYFTCGDDDAKIFCHKLVLAYHSPVFKSMFFGPMEEARDYVEAEDICRDDFLLVLSFLYTRTITFDSAESTWGIYYIAEKYLLDELRYLCVDALLKDVTVDTLFMSYEHATFYNLKRLADNYWHDILIVASDALKTRYHMKASTFRTLLSRDFINASDRDLFKRAVEWSKTECSLQNLEEEAVNVVAILKDADLLQRFRFDIRDMDWLKKFYGDLCDVFDFTTLCSNSGKIKRYTLAIPFSFRRTYKIRSRARLFPGFNETVVKANKQVNIYGMAITIPEFFIGNVFIYICNGCDTEFHMTFSLGGDHDRKYSIDEPYPINFDKMLVFESEVCYNIGIHFRTKIENVKLEMVTYFMDSAFDKSNIFSVRSEQVTGLVRGFQYFCT